MKRGAWAPSPALPAPPVFPHLPQFSQPSVREAIAVREHPLVGESGYEHGASDQIPALSGNARRGDPRITPQNSGSEGSTLRQEADWLFEACGWTRHEETAQSGAEPGPGGLGVRGAALVPTLSASLPDV